MPIPGEPMFVSVAAEIRDLTSPPEGGEPGKTWEARQGTTLLWLDDSTELPRNPLARLGSGPNEPADPLCPPVNATEE